MVEQFAWERLDRAAADFLYDNHARLFDAGLLDADAPTGGRLDIRGAGRAPAAR